MITTPDNLPPEEIERRSFAIIRKELGKLTFPPDMLPVVTRVIHTTADFDYAHTLAFSDNAVAHGLAVLGEGRAIVTDTQMAAAGINKKACSHIGCSVYCLIADPGVAEAAKHGNCTRSRAAVDAAAERWPDGVYAVGNAPTALIRICELVDAGTLRPGLVVGAPVGFVNVVESKELLLAAGVPHIVARGRKGGSTVAAAIINALLYMIARPA
ncbi:MAG: precorrin-8X methylmutase [Planctomycetaceae bacterium]|nr:precorrin-8X methylmutase [Planctomycetaceae bacterium]